MFVEKKKKPRKPCRTVFLLVAALAFASNAYADSCTTAYMPTFTAAQASTLCGRIGGAAPQMKNNTYLKGINTTGTPVALIGLNASNSTVLNSGQNIQLGIAGTPVALFSSSSNDAGLTLNTADTADAGVFRLGGGGGGNLTDSSRGSTLLLYGNENTGAVLIQGGAVATGNIQMRIAQATAQVQVQNTSGTPLVSIDNGGTSTFVNQINSGGSLVFTGTAGQYVRMGVYVPTAAATPALGVNQVLPGLNVIPTNAANNAVWLGASTPVAGDHFFINNNAGASIRVKGAGAATLNGATAGKYILMATGDFMECWTASTGAQVCGAYGPGTLPTPAGP